MIRRCLSYCRLLAISSLVLVGLSMVGTVFAYAVPVDNPQEGSIGVEGKIPSNPPSTAPTITTPRNGQSFTSIPISVNGICSSDLLVKVFSNDVFIGSVQCKSGSYSIQVDLFSGQNDLVARMFDSLDQGGPDSNVVTVDFNDSQFSPFGASLLSLTSNFASRGANPGQKLAWPVVLSGGTGPYAVSVDWGDGTSPDLMSTPFTGTVDLSHIYKSAGVYRVTVKSSDKNRVSAYLQLVATANGAVTSSSSGNKDASESKNDTTQVLWQPVIASVPLFFVSFWLGQRYELATLRKHLERRG